MPSFPIAQPKPTGSFALKRPRVKKNGPVRRYVPDVTNTQAVLSQGKGLKVNMPTKVAFENGV